MNYLIFVVFYSSAATSAEGRGSGHICQVDEVPFDDLEILEAKTLKTYLDSAF